MSSEPFTSDIAHAVESLERERTRALCRFIDLDRACRVITEFLLPKNCTLTCQDTLEYAAGSPRAVAVTITEAIPSLNRELRIRQFPEDADLWRAMRGWWRSRTDALLRRCGGKLPFEPLNRVLLVVATDANRYRDLDNYNLKLAIDAFASARIIKDDGSIAAYMVVRESQLVTGNCVRFLILESAELARTLLRVLMQNLGGLNFAPVCTESGTRPLYCEKHA